MIFILLCVFVIRCPCEILFLFAAYFILEILLLDLTRLAVPFSYEIFF
jgi:hypothetical protein